MNFDDPTDELRADHDEAARHLPPTPVSRWRRLPWRPIAIVSLASLVVLGAAGAAIGNWLVNSTPSVVDISRARTAEPSTITFAGGTLLARLGDTVYRPVKLAEVPPHVIDALLATEDARFREHHGVDMLRLAGACWSTLRGELQGGSTLTQQLARNLFPEEIGRSRTLWRKAREMTVALKIEQRYSKDQILEMYLNTVPFLYNVVGLEMASQTYFDRPASQLDTLQGATLVAMLKGSHQYNPVRHPERAKARRNLVLNQMLRHGTLAATDVADLSAKPLGLRFNRPDLAPVAAPHFVAQVRRQVEEWADAHGQNLERDGLVIETTLDADLQAMAEKSVQEQTAGLQRVADTEWSQRGLRSTSPTAKGPVRDAFAYFWKQNPELLDSLARDNDVYRAARKAGYDERGALNQVMADRETLLRLQQDKTRLEAGFVAMDPRNGEVRAYVGSRNFADDRYDHVSQAKRQPGSTFKPFVYGAALRAGYNPGRSYLDQPIEVRLPDGKLWKPTDMGGSSGMPMTLREGLAQSKNTITTQVAQDVGLPAIVDFARAAGVRNAKLDEVPSLALGTSPVSLMEMAGAYATLADLGVRHEPVMIRRISDRHGRVIADFAAKPQRVIDQPYVETLVDLMRDVVTSGTGAGLRGKFGVRGDVAGKTGTTQNNTDAWFIAIQPTLVTGAWVGFNDQRVTMRSDYWGQGGHSALLLVGDFMKTAIAARKLDTKERFPAVVRELPEPMPFSDQPVPEVPLADPSQDASIVPAPGQVQVVVQRDANGQLQIGDRRGAQVMRNAEPASDEATAVPAAVSLGHVEMRDAQ